MDSCQAIHTILLSDAHYIVMGVLLATNSPFKTWQVYLVASHSLVLGSTYIAVRLAMHMQRQAYFLGAAYAAPRKIKFPTELQKNRFFNLILEKK